MHALWAGLVLGANPLERWLRRRGAPPRTSTLAIFPVWYAMLALLERRRPHEQEWNPGAAEMRTDGAFFGGVTVAALTGQAVGAGLAPRLGVAARGGAGGGRLVPRLGIAGGVVASIAAFDLVHYSLHRLGHEWGPAWKFHSVHHSPNRLHIFNATRFHPVESFIEGTLEGAVLAVAGLSESQHVAHGVARATYGQLQHCNIDLDSGPLDHVFATPDLHRWHHSEVYAEGDTNYGAVTSVWDRLFGSFFRPSRGFDADLGIGRMPDFPQRFFGLLSVPFRWSAIKERNAATWYDDAATAANPDVHPRS